MDLAGIGTLSMNKLTRQKLITWTAVSISAVLANCWAYWGINENFHEGWYLVGFWNNVLLMFVQYLSLPMAFLLLAAVSIRWNKIGSLLHLSLAIGSYFFLRGSFAGLFLVAIPLIGLALLYWFAHLERRRLAYVLVIGLPLLQIVGIGTYHAIRIANRYNDDNFTVRQIEGNGITLTLAPQGPGWPDNGTSWLEAKKICAHLNSDGTKLQDGELNIWRLPTVDEAVRSMVYHGKNAGGVWDSSAKTAAYTFQPDKESPLWNIHLKTIYWWTSTEVDETRAYIVVYNGGVWPRLKTIRAGYLNFRAVKEVK
jgi:hypothetical protein